MKVVYKYGTGQEIPEGAVYLYTRIQGEFIWHYFLVEEEKE